MPTSPKPEDRDKGINWACLFLALFPVIGSFVVLVTYVLWYEGCLDMGFVLNWSVGWRDSIWAFVSFIGLPPSYFLLKKATKSGEGKARLCLLASSAISIIGPIVIAYVAIKNSVHVGSLPIFFGLLVGMVFGFGGYIQVTHKWKGPRHDVDSLRLTHDWIWRMIDILIVLVTALVATVYYVLYTDLLKPIVARAVSTSDAAAPIGKLGLAFSLPGILLLVGFWFGVLGPMLDYVLTIPWKVAKSNKGKQNIDRTS